MTEQRARTETTFFPDPREQASIATADIPTLAQMYRQQPGMSGRFTHELWRNRKDEAISNLARQGALTPTTYRDMSQSTIVMRVGMGEPESLARQFMVDVVEIAILEEAGTKDKSPESRALAEEVMRPILGAIDKAVIKIQSDLHDETKN